MRNLCDLRFQVDRDGAMVMRSAIFPKNSKIVSPPCAAPQKPMVRMLDPIYLGYLKCAFGANMPFFTSQILENVIFSCKFVAVGRVNSALASMLRDRSRIT